MEPAATQRAIAAAISCATSLGLEAEDAIVLNDSNRLVLRLLPCDVVARVAPDTHEAGSAALEVEVVRRLQGTGSAVAGLEPRVEPRAHSRDGFVIGMWAYYEPAAAQELRPVEYARMLERLHAGMRQVDIAAPHFMDRLTETEQWIVSRDITPGLADADRDLFTNILRNLKRSIFDSGAPEQLLHGEPHPWNVLRTRRGPLFIDFENAARGPVEYDLAWVPDEVSRQYENADQGLVAECRGLMLAIIAAWRWRLDDRHPSHPQREAWLRAFLHGPPWPALDTV